MEGMMMAEARNIRVMLRDIRYDLEGEIGGVIAMLVDAKATYEADGYSKIEIDISPYDEYGSATVDVELYGMRPENASEIATRQFREAELKARQKAHDLQQLAAIQARLGIK